ncbi:methionine--tRNA ligase [Bradymonadaceae bacterium TMQ3]|nr:methionine--tRNA ligase [Bradymonadaceae bacterium TMQ3]TXC77487.1 methionine--tRNA ligase [Bradymonadales bacterium TMQ1]
MSNFYLTTPIYYVNGAPHIGHAYTTIIADAFARYRRQKGDEVFFLTGTDEHGLKIQRAAEDRGISPQQMVDENSARFRELFEQLRLTHDRFIRTTDADHKKTVAEMVARMKASGDIYLDKYEGWYAAADEAYYDESEIADGKATATGASVEWVEEESYFFKLSKYAEPLLEWYRSNPDAITPSGRRNEVASFVEGGLRDLSISRTTFSWGIPMPEHPEHVLYVWVDALTNYITAVGAFDDPKRFETFWPADIHFIGKDILRFHAVYWPAFLMSAGLALPKQIVAHGWWTNDGIKMSKSLGNVIDAFELAERYDLDVLRYYLLREIPIGNDGNFSDTRVVERNNAELADNIGNLVNRTFAMAGKFIGGSIPAPRELTESEDIALRDAAFAARDAIDKAFGDRELHRALEHLMAFSSEVNNYIQRTQPWALNKEGKTERLEQTLYNALESIRWIALLAAPFTPDASRKILAGFGQTTEAHLSFETLKTWANLPAGTPLEAPGVLFSKLEAPVEEDDAGEKSAPQDQKPAKKAKKDEKKVEKSKKSDDSESTGLIEFGDFTKVEIRVGEVLTAEKVEGADKLLKLSANVGEEAPRTIVAGIAKAFAPEELVGLRVAMVTNLKPAKLFGIKSEAMILAAKTTDGKLALARYDERVEVGTRIS